MNYKNILIFIFLSVFLFTTSVIIGCDINLKDRIINPKGWNLPDLKRMEKKTTEYKKFTGIESTIQIDFYSYEDEKQYFIYNKYYNKDWVFDPNTDVVEWIGSLTIYRIYESQEILCYEYICIKEQPRPKYKSESKSKSQDKMKYPYGVVGGVTGPMVLRYIFDIDGDGINESLLPIGREPENLLLSILQYKYEQLQQKKDKQID